MSKFLKTIETLNARMSFLSFLIFIVQHLSTFRHVLLTKSSFLTTWSIFGQYLLILVNICLILINIWHIGQYLSIFGNILWYLSTYGTAHVPILPILLISSISVPILPISAYSAYSASICTHSAYWRSAGHSVPHHWARPATCPGTPWLPPRAIGNGHYIHINIYIYIYMYIYMYTNNTSTRG